MLNKFLKAAKLFAAERGATMVEYTIMLALIIVVALTAIKLIGTSAETKLTQIGTDITAAAPPAGP